MRRRGEKPPPARRVILRDERMAGFPLSHDFFFRQLERKSVNKITRKRQNHAFAFFTLQQGAAQGKVNLRGVYKREPLKCRAKRKTPRLAEGRPAGLSYPHGVPQAAACRGTRELKSPKEAKRRFCLFSLVSIRMEVNFFAVYKT